MEILVPVRQFCVLVNQRRRIWCPPGLVEAGKNLFFVLLITIIYTFLLCFTEPGVEVDTCVLKMRASSLKETFCILMFLELLFLPKMTTVKDRYIPVNFNTH